MRAVRRGSGDAPKVLLFTERGRLMLKRRGVARADPDRVAFTHRVQAHLAGRGFALPRLIGTRDANRSVVRLGDRLYELFEFVAGEPFDGSLEETAGAGRALAVFHRLLADFDLAGAPDTRGFHDNAVVLRHLDEVEQRLDPAGDGRVARELRDLYVAARDRVEALGAADWPRQAVHGDWHPGNVVFRAREVASVLDYDAAHVDMRASDVASGALQFSIVRDGADATAWPAHTDENRFEAFLRGYDGVSGARLSGAELDATPALMIESLVAEATGPVAAGGSFGRFEGGAFLRMIERKARWLEERGSEMCRRLDGSG